MGWKVRNELSFSFKPLAALVTEVVRSHDVGRNARIFNGFKKRATYVSKFPNLLVVTIQIIKYGP